MALQKVKGYVNAQKIKNSFKAMAGITHNITAFDDMVSAIAREIIDKKQNQILNAQEDKAASGFVAFLKSAKGWAGKKFLGEVDDAPKPLKSVIKLAAKDATLIVAACMIGEINSQGDNLTYDETKKEFVALIIKGAKFKEDFNNVLKDQTTQSRTDSESPWYSFLCCSNKSNKSKYQIDEKNPTKVLASFDINYDNKILNHPELLKLSAQQFGFSKAIKLCSGLSNDLVIEAILEDSSELILAGCISLSGTDIVLLSDSN